MSVTPRMCLRRNFCGHSPKSSSWVGETRSLRFDARGEAGRCSRRRLDVRAGLCAGVGVGGAVAPAAQSIARPWLRPAAPPVTALKYRDARNTFPNPSPVAYVEVHVSARHRASSERAAAPRRLAVADLADAEEGAVGVGEQRVFGAALREDVVLHARRRRDA